MSSLQQEFELYYRGYDFSWSEVKQGYDNWFTQLAWVHWLEYHGEVK